MDCQLVCFVEGSDDQHVVKKLLEANGLTEWQVVDTKGKTKLLSSLEASRKGSVISALAVILDADGDLTGTWASVCNCLTKAGYEDLPHGPSPDGTIIVQPNEPPLVSGSCRIMMGRACSRTSCPH